MQEHLLRHRPAVFVALAMIAGSVAAAAQWITTDAALILLAAGLVPAILRLRNATFTFISLAIAIAGFAAVNVLQSRQCETSMCARIALLRPEQAVVVGSVLETKPYNDGFRWLVELDSLALKPADNSPRRSMPVRARLLVWAKIPVEDFIVKRAHGLMLPHVGDRIRLFTDLRGIRAATNPYEFERDRSMQRQLGVDAMADVRSVFDYTIIQHSPPSFAFLNNYLTRIRKYVLTCLRRSIHDPQPRAFVEAVVLGERGDLDHEVYEDFTKAGIAHILAVSGFNVAIIAAVVAQLLRLFGVWRLRLRTLILMLSVLLYSAVVGFEPSVVRALLMIEIYFASLLLERKRDAVNIVAFAAVLDLVLRPNDLFDVGFQLSYVCVFGLVAIAPELKRLLLPRSWDARALWLRRTADVLVMSLAATLASAPVIVLHFHRVSIAGLLTNFPAIPLSSAITALGFLLIPLSAVNHWLVGLYGDAVSLLTSVLLRSTSIAAAFRIASKPVSQPTWIALVAYIGAVVYLLRSGSRPQFVGRAIMVIVLIFVARVAGARMTHEILATEDAKLHVLFDDVGQGDCIYIHTPHGKNYVIDCGPISRSGIARVENSLLPLLRAESQTNIDGVFLSHMHRDHYGGAGSLMKNCSIGSIYSSGERVPDPLAQSLDSIAQRMSVRCRTLSRGDILEIDSGVWLYVLHPGRKSADHMRIGAGTHANAGSLAFKICYGRTSFLFLGDMERSEEELLKDEYGDFLRSSVVKVAHHGSLTSSSRLFASEVKPEWAVISVGDNNRFGHPAQAIVRRWSGLGARVARTDQDGAVLFEADGHRVEHRDWREF